MIEVTVTVTDPRIQDDQLVREWCTAMERKLSRLLEESGSRIIEEAIWSHENGLTTGDYHVLVAQHRGMK